MSEAMEDLIAVFATEDKKETAVRMLERGKLSKEEIAEDLKLPLEVVEELANDLQSV